MDINEKMDLHWKILATLGLIDDEQPIAIRPDLISEEYKQTVSKRWEKTRKIVDKIWDENFSDIKSVSETTE
jgi:hypothetical protein